MIPFILLFFFETYIQTLTPVGGIHILHAKNESDVARILSFMRKKKYFVGHSFFDEKMTRFFIEKYVRPVNLGVFRKRNQRDVVFYICLIK